MNPQDLSKLKAEWEPPLLAEELPDLAQEIQRLLVDDGESDLAGQVATLKVVDRCCCGDYFCGSFRTAPAPNGSYGPSHRTLVLDPATGMLNLDIVEGRIVYVEVLYNDDIRDAIERIVP